MGTYRYTGKNIQGKRVSGSMEANSDRALYARLKEMDIMVESYKEVESLNTGFKLKPKVLTEFCRSMGTLLHSGVSLVRALSIVSKEETTAPKHRAIYTELLRLVRSGILISDAMTELEVFPPMLVHMIKSAEASGNLDTVFLQMADYYEKSYKLAGKVKSAMAYPAFLAVLTFGVVILLFTFVIPQFESLFATMPELPLLTRILMGLSDGFKKNWLLIIIVIGVTVTVGSVLIKVPAVRYELDKLKVRLPYFGKLNATIYTARFARTLSSLYQAGLPLSNALQISANTVSNTYIAKQLEESITRVRSGESLSDALNNVEGFVKKLPSSILIGEETGSLDVMLNSVSDMLEYESEAAVNRMVGLLEPLMIVIMAVIVLFVIIGVILPIYNSYGSIGASAY